MTKAGKGRAGAPVPVASRAERRRDARLAASGQAAAGSSWRTVLAGRAATSSFLVAAGLLLLGPIFLLLSQALPHDYGFLELGGLFTLSLYDLVLAILGLSVGTAMAETAADWRAVVGVFTAVLFVMLLFFDPIFEFLRQTPLGDTFYLVAPIAVASAGLALWLPARLRRHGLAASAALVAFSLSLFIGLDDFGVGIADFAWGSGFAALWLLVAPGLMLRQFRGPWLTIPSRIVGSWLVVIAIIVTVTLYVPMPVAAPPPPTTGLQSGPGQGDLPMPGEGGEE